MINIDKVIDGFNEDLDDRITDEIARQKLREEFRTKLEIVEEPKVEVSTNADYLRVLDGKEYGSEGITTTASTLPEGTSLIYDFNSINDRVPVIREHDQVRLVKFSRKDLLLALGLTDDAYHSPYTNDEVELKVTIIGRDCDRYGNPINPE